ncbi:MAG TPA: indole-3-glycerol phosphate synthase TrpC [Phycisphaerales bacterium]|nr:indole-3-glycerol phosphate synthase TrpC [Phycisphaerales bacterium]HMP37205.1 indole-3-glycerol phosphate synthase TrpC [Phycisphaerales bacterium]
MHHGNGILSRIGARKRVEVARAIARTPPEALRERVASMPRPRNFFSAVVDERDLAHSRIIAEIKRKSPSAGVIRSDFDPVVIARQYHEAGAAALSCLTDEADFGGRLEYIEQIRAAVPLPVLRKDFIVDEYQVWESRAAGADAILLIAELLSEGEIIDLQILSTELGMTVLLEVHDVENLLRLRQHVGFPHSGYSLLGINNRNLATMTTDLRHTFRLLDLIDDRSIRRVLVSESGISTPDDLRRLREHGVNIALVGESLMREADPGAALRALLAAG